MSDAIKKPSKFFFFVLGLGSFTVVGFFLLLFVFSLINQFAVNLPHYIFNGYFIFFASFVIGVVFCSFEYGGELRKYLAYEDATNLKIQAERDALIKKENLLRKRKEEEARIRSENEKKRKEQEEHNELLRKVEELEAAKSRGKAKGLEELFRVQIELMIKYKKEGLNIEKDIYEMRGKLLSLEREENNVMIQDLLRTLDSL